MEKDQAKGGGVQGRSLRDRLGQWESRLAPLSEKQKDSFMELSSAATFRPLPAEVSHLTHVLYLFVASVQSTLFSYLASFPGSSHYATKKLGKTLGMRLLVWICVLDFCPPSMWH